MRSTTRAVKDSLVFVETLNEINQHLKNSVQAERATEVLAKKKKLDFAFQIRLFQCQQWENDYNYF